MKTPHTGSSNLNSMKTGAQYLRPQVLDLLYFLQGIRFFTKSELNSRRTVPGLAWQPRISIRRTDGNVSDPMLPFQVIERSPSKGTSSWMP